MKIYEAKENEFILHVGHDYQDYFAITKTKSQKIKYKRKHWYRFLVQYKRLNSNEVINEFSGRIQHWNKEYGAYKDKSDIDNVWFGGDYVDDYYYIRYQLKFAGYLIEEKIFHGKIELLPPLEHRRKYQNFNFNAKISKNYFLMSPWNREQKIDTDTSWLEILYNNKLIEAIKNIKINDILIINRITGNFRIMNLDIGNIQCLTISPDDHTFAVHSWNKAAIVDIDVP